MSAGRVVLRPHSQVRDVLFNCFESEGPFSLLAWVIVSHQLSPSVTGTVCKFTDRLIDNQTAIYKLLLELYIINKRRQVPIMYRVRAMRLIAILSVLNHPPAERVLDHMRDMTNKAPYLICRSIFLNFFYCMYLNG